jgi:hypothetical protein
VPLKVHFLLTVYTLQYVELKEANDIQFVGLIEYMEYFIDNNYIENDILKKIITVEFYLRPLAILNLEK